MWCLTDVFKIRSICPTCLQATLLRSGPLDSTLTGPSHHRSHPLSIQWVSLRDFDSFIGIGKEEVDDAPQWPPLRWPSLPEAHLPISRTSIFRILATSILPRPKIDFSYQIWKCAKIGLWDHCCVWCRLWTIRILGPATAATEQTVSILQRTMSCVLGSQCLGNVLLH